MSNLDLCYTPATELAARVRAKDVSPVELVENSLARIEEVNPTLNCFCFTFPNEALDKARAAEAAVLAGESLGPLHGVPIAIKDATPTKGKRTTIGSAIYENWVPDFDALVVENLEAAGGIMVGKTTTPEFAFKRPAVADHRRRVAFSRYLPGPRRARPQHAQPRPRRAYPHALGPLGHAPRPQR